MIEIDPQLLKKAEELARRKGQPFSTLVEQSLLKSIEADQRESHGTQVYGEPLSDEDIAASGRVTFRMLDEDEAGSEPR